MPDHLHFFLGLRPAQSISGLLQDIKGDSSKWINKRKLVNGRFSWQDGYGAFSYSKPDLKSGPVFFRIINPEGVMGGFANSSKFTMKRNCFFISPAAF